MGPTKLGYWDMGTLKLGYLGYRDPPPLHTPNTVRLLLRHHQLNNTCNTCNEQSMHSILSFSSTLELSFSLLKLDNKYFYNLPLRFCASYVAKIIPLFYMSSLLLGHLSKCIEIFNELIQEGYGFGSITGTYP